MVRFSMTCPSVAEVVFSSGAVDWTSTVLVTSPTWSSMSAVTCCCTSSLKAGCVALGVGSSLLKPEILKAQNWLELTRLAEQYREIVRKFRTA